MRSTACRSPLATSRYEVPARQRFLLDTNTISEWVKPRPDPGVVRWFDQVDEDRIYLSVITLGEIRKGVARLADGRRRDRLDRWLSDELPDRFTDRILPVTTAVRPTNPIQSK